MKAKIGLLTAFLVGVALVSAVFGYGRAMSSTAAGQAAQEDQAAGGCHFLNLDYFPPVAGTVLVYPEPNCAGTGYANGTVVTIMSVARFYYSHLFWALSPTPGSNPNTNYPVISFVMDQSYSANALFGGVGAPPGSCRALVFTSEPLDWGGVNNDPVSNCGQWYDVGTDITLTPFPMPDKYFSYWTITPTIDPPYTTTNPVAALNMSEHFEVVTHFSLDQRISGLMAENDGPTELGATTMLTAVISAGTNVTFSWDFGDGNFGSGPNPGHIYPEAGVYTATVTASNSTNSQTAETVVTVVNSGFAVFMPVVAKP